MIEYALLIMLGFCVGGLIAFLLAPTLWHRAVRLTTKRLEATMPMSLSDIEADKDLLRASYAIKIRRLEASLNTAREKSANQLVDVSKLQMRIGELNDEIAKIEMQLDERRNAANVFENTIRKRFPELENMVAAAKALLDDRAQEIADLTSKVRRRDEVLALAQRAGTLQQQEIRTLRETLEKTGSDISGRFKRRPSQWTLDEYRSEYDRLNVELSKMREQLILAQEREAGQIAVLKTELQQLGEQIMASAAAQVRRQAAAEQRAEMEAKAWPGPRVQTPDNAKRSLPARPLAKTQPWPGEKPRDAAPMSRETVRPERNLPERSQSREGQATPASPARSTTRSRSWITPAVATTPPAARDPSVSGGEVPTKTDLSSSRPTVEQTTRDALKTLLNRGARMPGSSKEQTDKAGIASEAAAAGGLAQAATELAGATSLSEAGSMTPNGSADKAASSAQSSGPNLARDANGAASEAEPKLDKVVREIFEGRPATPGNAGEGASSGEADRKNGDEKAAISPDAAADGTDQAGAGADAASEAGNKARTLLDRLRMLQERQTG